MLSNLYFYKTVICVYKITVQCTHCTYHKFCNINKIKMSKAIFSPIVVEVIISCFGKWTSSQDYFSTWDVVNVLIILCLKPKQLFFFDKINKLNHSFDKR